MQHASGATISDSTLLQKLYDCMVQWLEWWIFKVAFTPNTPFTELN